MNVRRLAAIMLKELRQMRRDRITLAMIIGVPVMQLVLFGYAINLNLRGLDAGIADQANTAASRALVMDMLATGVIEPTAVVATPQELVELLRRGRISVGVAIPPDFERRLHDGRQVGTLLRFERQGPGSNMAVNVIDFRHTTVLHITAHGGRIRGRSSGYLLNACTQLPGCLMGEAFC